MSKAHTIFLLKTVIHLLSAGLLANLYYQAIVDQLGADPVEAVLHFTGIGAFNLLLLSLTVSPLVKCFKWQILMKVRRLLGLYSFTYALCHVLSFLAFEVQFNWTLFIDEVIERPYITVGMSAFVILFALAVTSISRLKKQLGRHWQLLHNWVYLALLLIALHFYWSVKSEVIEPSIYVLICLVLLWLRKKKLTRRFTRRVH
ncbi:protein-methionine-sulfoxide reductase heme-binding subunit MsrQ [Thalassotalea sp. G2M2-11]|uniref:protein-methionine-sulfoxide reductase heme-binding subunit MsrQ n=1 Tax=Thalassotalea sp. G2M2-11 TaxID=2787627 RepID=UPI001F495657|nr:protein-methionine-sulfoxide reductase heme-binding subunit MsrQ [Thalassotalea sp. G2M2-11]